MFGHSKITLMINVLIVVVCVAQFVGRVLAICDDPQHSQSFCQSCCIKAGKGGGKIIDEYTPAESGFGHGTFGKGRSEYWSWRCACNDESDKKEEQQGEHSNGYPTKRSMAPNGNTRLSYGYGKPEGSYGYSSESWQLPERIDRV